MSDRLVIVPAEIGHVYQLAPKLREADRLELEATGVEPRQALRRMMRQSVHCRTAFVDGEIAAMWGLAGDLLGDTGRPWLLTTPAIARVPLAYVRAALRERDAMLAIKPVLVGWVMASYRGACRLLEVAGATCEPPAPVGPRGVLHHEYRIAR